MNKNINRCTNYTKNYFGYIRWYFAISHLYIVEDAHILRPLEQEAIVEVTVEEHGDQQ